jgi:hypothetical protein
VILLWRWKNDLYSNNESLFRSIYLC